MDKEGKTSNKTSNTTSLENLIDSLIHKTETNIQSAIDNYFSQVEQTIKNAVSAIISSLDQNTPAQAIQSIISGMQKYVSMDSGLTIQIASAINPSFQKNLANFEHSMQDNMIDLKAMQTNLHVLVAQASQMRATLLEGLASGTIPLAISAKLPANSIQQETQSIIENLNKLLIYLKATQQELQAYQKTSPQEFLATAGGIGLANQTMNSHANMYGVDVQVGYKQFFGKKKRWGLRYYGSFSYQRGVFYDKNIASLNDLVYGVGMDALYNFYESKDGRYITGMFLGFMLAGNSWVVPSYHTLHTEMSRINEQGGKAKMNSTYFQIPLNIGFRTNVNKHNGFEIGLRIPLATNYYFKGNLHGSSLETTYKRNVAMYFNYVYNF
ncbi:outer membrane protein [Helicobacter felis]|uniref:outer membrane protein n=1 Tax=Helicobacter felis TaxID=214 RepID=UPI001F3D1D8A|nr:outer membrane protein [Helicobacter felis]